MAFPHFCTLKQPGAESGVPRSIFIMNAAIAYPNSMEDEWKAFLGQGFPLAQRVDYSSGSSDAQLVPIEELGGQREQGLMGTVVVNQLSHLK